MNEQIITHKEVYRILMVDDDELFRKAHKRLLHLVHFSRINAFFEVVDVDSAANAMKALKETSFDCVLLDYVMPECSGLKCLKDIVESWPDLPVILFTGAGNERVAAGALKDGAIDYLIKGKLTLETLERAIVSAITKAAMVKQIEDQRKQLMDAERNRVMAHTLAACSHHLSQPVTVLRTFLVMMKRNESVSGEVQEMVTNSFVAIETICDILWRMNHITEYTTESYLNTTLPGEDNEILKM